VGAALTMDGVVLGGEPRNRACFPAGEREDDEAVRTSWTGRLHAWDVRQARSGSPAAGSAQRGGETRLSDIKWRR